MAKRRTFALSVHRASLFCKDDSCASLVVGRFESWLLRVAFAWSNQNEACSLRRSQNLPIVASDGLARARLAKYQWSGS